MLMVVRKSNVDSGTARVQAALLEELREAYTIDHGLVILFG
jgi:hypothetical protein